LKYLYLKAIISQEEYEKGNKRFLHSQTIVVGGRSVDGEHDSNDVVAFAEYILVNAVSGGADAPPQVTRKFKRSSGLQS